MLIPILIPRQWRKVINLAAYAFVFPATIVFACVIVGLAGVIEAGSYRGPQRLDYAALSAGVQQSGWYSVPNCSISVGSVSLAGADPATDPTVGADDHFYMPVYNTLHSDAPARMVIHTNDPSIVETINAMWQLKRQEKNRSLQQYADAHPERMWVNRIITGEVISQDRLLSADRVALSRIPDLAPDFVIIDDGHQPRPLKQSLAFLSAGLCAAMGTLWLWAQLLRGREFFGHSLYDVPGLGPSVDNFRRSRRA
jgi:hypothetical protein